VTRPPTRPRLVAPATAGGGLLLVLLVSLGAPGPPPAAGQLLPTLPTAPTTAPTNEPPTTPAPTAAPEATRPVPTVAVATVPTTRPRATTTTAAEATTSSTEVPTTPAPITVPPDTTPVTTPLELVAVKEASYSLLPLLVTLTAFAVALAILTVPALVDRIRNGPDGRSAPAPAGGARRLAQQAGGLVGGARAAVARRGARPSRGAPPTDDPAGADLGVDAADASARASLRDAPPARERAPGAPSRPPPWPADLTGAPEGPAIPADSEPVHGPTPATTARRAARAAGPKPDAAARARPKRPAKLPRPAPERPAQELWGAAPEGRVPADDPLAVRPGDVRPPRRPPSRRTRED